MVIICAFINMFFESAQHNYFNTMKLVANMHKLCYEVCVETQNDVTIAHGYQLWECITMITCITCITSKLWAILFSLHDASHIDLQQLRAWFLSLDNSQSELGLASFQPRNKPTVIPRVINGFIHSHITSSDLVDNNAVSLYSQLNGLLTTLGPHSVHAQCIHH